MLPVMAHIDQSITDYLDYWDSKIVPTEETEQPLKRGKGRPATGRTTKTVRVPKDMDVDKAIQMYYEWLPVIDRYRDILAESPNSVRNEKLARLLEELG